MVVRLTAYNNERDTVVNVESYKITYKHPPIAHAHEGFDDLYLNIDQKWSDYGLTSLTGPVNLLRLMLLLLTFC